MSSWNSIHTKLLALGLVFLVSLASASRDDGRVSSALLKGTRIGRLPELDEGRTGNGANATEPSAVSAIAGSGASAEGESKTPQAPKPFDEAPTGTQDEVLAGEDWDGNRTVAESVEAGEMVYRSLPGGNPMPDPPADYYDDGDTELETKVKAGAANDTVSDGGDHGHLGHTVKKGAEDFYHKGLKPAGHWAFQDVLKPVGQGLGTAGKNTYEDVLKPAGKWTHEKVIKPSYDHAIKPAGKWTAKNIGKPLGDAFGFDESANPNANMYGYEGHPGYMSPGSSYGGGPAGIGAPQFGDVEQYHTEYGPPASPGYGDANAYATPVAYGIDEPSALQGSFDESPYFAAPRPNEDTMGLVEAAHPAAVILPSYSSDPVYPY